MSYDLMVFDVATAPRDLAAFMSWYDQQIEWNESHGYHDPTVTTPKLRAWLQEMTESLPPMQGPLAGDVKDARTTDYGIGR